MKKLIPLLPLAANLAACRVLVEQPCTAQQEEFIDTTLSETFLARDNINAEISRLDLPIGLYYASPVLEDLETTLYSEQAPLIGDETTYSCAVNRIPGESYAGQVRGNDRFLYAVDNSHFMSAFDVYKRFKWVLSKSPQELREAFITNNDLEVGSDFTFSRPDISMNVLKDIFMLGGGIAIVADTGCHEQAHLTLKVSHPDNMEARVSKLPPEDRIYLKDTAYSMGGACLLGISDRYDRLLWYVATGDEAYMNLETEMPSLEND